MLQAIQVSVHQAIKKKSKIKYTKKKRVKGRKDNDIQRQTG